MEENKLISNFFIKIVNQMDFDIYVGENKTDKEKVFGLTDLQGGNLANIENGTFSSFGDILDRLENYIDDYYYRSLEEREDDGEKIFKNDFDKIVTSFIESETVLETLEEITPEAVIKNPSLFEDGKDIQDKDILKILEDEKTLDNTAEFFNKNDMKILIGKDIKTINDMYKELLKKQDINFSNIKTKNAENSTSYQTSVEFKDGRIYGVETKDISGIRLVSQNISEINDIYIEKVLPLEEIYNQYKLQIEKLYDEIKYPGFSKEVTDPAYTFENEVLGDLKHNYLSLCESLNENIEGTFLIYSDENTSFAIDVNTEEIYDKDGVEKILNCEEQEDDEEEE